MSTSAQSSSREGPIGLRAIDWGLILAAALIAALLTAALANTDPRLLADGGMDQWFEADTARVFENLTDRWISQYRSTVHPAFALLVSSPTIILAKLIGSKLHAVVAELSVIAGLSVGSVALVLCLIGTPRLAVVASVALLLSSASFIYFFGAPESFALGGAVMVFALATSTEPWRRFSRLQIVAGTLAAAITITNWMAGLAVLVVCYPLRTAFRMAMMSFLLLAILAAVQSNIYTKSGPFLELLSEGHYAQPLSVHHVLDTMKGVFVEPIVAPAAHIGNSPEAGPGEIKIIVSASEAPLPIQDWPGRLAVTGWLLLLAFGVWGLFVRLRSNAYRIALMLVLAGQFALSVKYGGETFLYTADKVPLLILFAALGYFTPARYLVVVLTLLTAGATAAHNLDYHRTALDLLNQRLQVTDTARGQLLAVERAHPGIGWPRGDAHAVLGWTGGSAQDKAYVENGGGFSPAVGSFGVAIAVLDQAGTQIATSDTIPLADIHQSYIAQPDADTPAYSVETPYYTLRWFADVRHRWHGVLTPHAGFTGSLAVDLRSAGPSGGRVTDMRWTAPDLSLNHSWNVTLSGTPSLVWLRDDETLAHAAPGEDHFTSFDGWAASRLAVPSQGTEMVIWQGALPKGISAWPDVTLAVPDKEFTASLEAQTATLLMGLVGDELRPADPEQYPMSWQRDGAYITVALARAGQLDVARKLALRLARDDFFGGYGAEADAPGLALWAMGEVSADLHSAIFDARIWPDVQRKADFIIQMRHATQPIRHAFSGAAVPEYEHMKSLNLVANAAANGLIQGRMDWSNPVLFINAVSYRGLLAAAALAQHMGHPDDQARWQDEAASLRSAWNAVADPAAWSNPRTLISALWPTYVDADQAAFRTVLQRHWDATRTAAGGFDRRPDWSYFDIAEAHQWLVLGDPDKAWMTMRWFWDHAPMPGLYTLWEGSGDENTSHRWDAVRGWVNPTTVTPHYWSAAEMLLLQLDMLAMVDQSGTAPRLVIGAGVPAPWLAAPISVDGLRAAGRTIDWSWDGHAMTVRVVGSELPVTLGPAFPAGTPLATSFAAPGAAK